MKGDIHSYVLSTSSFLCDIGEPRFRQNNTRYQIIKIVKYELIPYLKIWYPVLFCLYLGSPTSHRRLLVLKTYLWIYPFIWSQAVLSAISGSQDTGITIHDIIFQEYGMYLYLTSLIIRYPILFCLYFGFPMSHRKLRSYGCQLSSEICLSF